MDTKHAVGLRTKAGNGLLIHVGIDTVQLGGKYFDVHVTEGQELKAGDCIMDFDKDKIREEGYDTRSLFDLYRACGRVSRRQRS